MKGILIIVGIVILPWLHGADLENIKIKSLRNKPIIECVLNGKRCYFLVDTGSDITIINSKVNKKYNFKTHPNYRNGKAYGLGSQGSEIRNTSNVQLSIGEIDVNTKFYSLDIDHIANSILSKAKIRIIGIIGSDVLLKYNFVIDYKNESITLSESESKKKNIAKRK